jgi:SAM-dependent methyltransferase
MLRNVGKRVVKGLRGLAPGFWMRSDWDRRARKDARRFIACGHSDSDESFWASGRRDLDQLVLHDVELAPPACALEIGCGVGRLLRPLSERIDRVLGADISPEMVRRARELLADRPNVEVFVTDGSLASVADASLDFLYSFIVFQHIPAKRAVAGYIREASRTLKGRGVFRFQVDGRPRPKSSAPDTWLGVWYKPEELREELAGAGFSVSDLWGEGTHYLWTTAVRESRPGRPDSVAVSLKRRHWRRERIEALLARLELDVSGADAILSGRSSVRQVVEGFLSKNARLKPEAFVRRAYEVLLGREADEAGLDFYSREIASGVPPSNTVDCLISSSELEDRLRPLVDGG